MDLQGYLIIVTVMLLSSFILYKPKDMNIAKVLTTFVIIFTGGAFVSYYYTEPTIIINEAQQEHSRSTRESITLNTKDGQQVFEAGKDFPLGRYKITNNNEKEGLLFVWGPGDTGKIASEVMTEGTSNYTVTFKEDMALSILDAEEFLLTPIDDEVTLSTGYWDTNTDVDLTEGNYEVLFNKPGCIRILDKDRNEKKKITNEDADRVITIEDGDIINVIITDEVTFLKTI